jgi:CheY-like chemotaxis protein
MLRIEHPAEIPEIGRSMAGIMPVGRDRPAVDSPVEAPAPIRGRILLVDDNDSVRETLADLLEMEGFEAVQAANAEQAVTLMQRDPMFDVLVTDLSMPGDDGIALIHQARAIQHAIPAILLTGYAEEVTSIAAIGGCNYHVLRKPVQSDRLVEQLAVLMHPPGTA